jgi:hypothetical protein
MVGLLSLKFLVITLIRIHACSSYRARSKGGFDLALFLHRRFESDIRGILRFAPSRVSEGGSALTERVDTSEGPDEGRWWGWHRFAFVVGAHLGFILRTTAPRHHGEV